MIIAGQGVLYAEAATNWCVRRAARRAGDDDDRRQERVPRGPCAGAGLGRPRSNRPWPPFLHESDIIFAVGTSLTKHNISTPIIPDGKRIIHATNDTRDLFKTHPCEVPILGDAKLVLAQMIAAVKDRLGTKKRSTGARKTIAT